MKDKINVQEIVIDGKTYVPKDSRPPMAERGGLPFVLIRTERAGVFCGYLEDREANEVVLRDAIRLWYWKGAASLSQLAMEGVSIPGECKFAVPVDEITLLGVIEVIPMTDSARVNVQGVKSWRA